MGARLGLGAPPHSLQVTPARSWVGLSVADTTSFERADPVRLYVSFLQARSTAQDRMGRPNVRAVPLSNLLRGEPSQFLIDRPSSILIQAEACSSVWGASSG